MQIPNTRIFLICLTFISYIVVFSCAALAGMHVSYSEIFFYALFMILIFGAGILYTSLRDMAPLRYLFEALLCGFLLVAPIGLSTYLAIGMNMPLADNQLIKMDEALGFDWHAFIAFVDSHPWLSNLLLQSYQSFSFQLIGIPILLALFGQYARMFVMISAYGLLCFVSSFISIWFPALGTYSIYGVAQSDLQSINAHFGFAFLEQFHAVYKNPDFVFNFAKMSGILTFPSVHAAVAFLCIWSTWSMPYIRYPFLIMNIFMIFSTVSHANHYFVDSIAGMIIAAASIGFIRAAILPPERFWELIKSRRLQASAQPAAE